MKVIGTFLVLVAGLSLFAKDKDSLPFSPAKGSETSLFPTKNPAVSSEEIKKFQQQKQAAPQGGAPGSAQPQTIAAQAPGMSQPYVAAVDTYGSSRINEVLLRETL